MCALLQARHGTLPDGIDGIGGHIIVNLLKHRGVKKLMNTTEFRGDDFCVDGTKQWWQVPTGFTRRWVCLRAGDRNQVDRWGRC